MDDNAADGDDDDDYLDVRTKDILVVHLPELKVSNHISEVFTAFANYNMAAVSCSSFYWSSMEG